MKNLERRGFFLLFVIISMSAICLSPSKGANLHDYCPIHSEHSIWETVTTPNPFEIPVDNKSFCFAEGTDPEYVAEVSRNIYGNFSNPLDYTIYDRWVNTAYGSAGSQGDPITLTYSFVPDGVTVPDHDPPNGYGAQPSSLYATMNSYPNFPTEASWKEKFAEAFAYWGDKIGITFIETVDDGASLYDPTVGYGHSPGVVGVRGDIRIAAYSMDGAYGVLAYNRYPDIGDMVMDISEDWDSPTYDYGYLKNVVAHELGHAIGFGHVCPNGCTILMDPYLCSSIGGPQHDDIRAGQRNYGDYLEENDNYSNATDLGYLTDGTIYVQDVSSDDNTDEDWYEFEVGASKQVSILLDIVGATYLNCTQNDECSCSTTINTLDDADLGVWLYDSNGTTILDSETSQPAAVDEFISEYPLLDAGTYYIRVTSDASNAVQMYDLEITIEPGTAFHIDVLSPNGDETWRAYTTETITWSSINMTGNVNIELNRNYPIGSWEMLFANTADDGTQDWPVTGPATTYARVRVTSVDDPIAFDESDGWFTINVPSITITRPNGGESFEGYASESIQWSTHLITGDIVIELNRDYPSGSWEYIDTVPNTGASVAFGPPAATNARLRLSSEDLPGAFDISDADFTIAITDNPPELMHQQHGDTEPGTLTFVTIATDDHSAPVVKLFHRLYGSADYDSTLMTETGNTNEFSCDLSLAAGRYEYYLRANDSVMQMVSTGLFTLDVGNCDYEIALDDGSAEGFNWAQEIEYEWAIKIEPESYPFMLCGMKAAIARISPEDTHTPVLAKVYDSDGAAGLPGTELWSETSGSIGNVPGGLPAESLYWTIVWVDSGNGSPLVLNAPFYLAFSNPVTGKQEAFGRDDNTPTAGTSFFYEGCEFEWLSEADAHENAQGGTRMIRALGYSLAAPDDLVIYSNGSDIELNWTGTGSPYYKVFSSTDSDGPFTTFEGSTDDTFFVDTDAVSGDLIKFYIVVGSVEP